MGIKPRFSQPEIKQDLNLVRQKIERDLMKILQFTGEEFVKEARLMGKGEGGFGDVTGNLRSSIGYFILKDGEVISENLRIQSGSTLQKVTEEGKSAARRVVSGIDKGNGYQLVGVAGMDYASHVESKGYNVISSQADLALVNIGSRLKKYAARMNSMGFKMTSDSVITKFR